MNEGLSQKEIAALLKEVSSSEAAAGRLGANLAGSKLTPSDRLVAEQVLRQMLTGAAIRVRQVLADVLKDSPHLPRDVAVALANDVESVALPILHFSMVLTDADLLAVIRSGTPAKQVAIAGRDTVSSAVAGELLATENGAAVARLVGNPGASLDETQLAEAATRFGSDPRVAQSLQSRPGLPLSVAERLVAFTVETLRDYISSRSDLPESVVSPLIIKTRETVTVDLLGPHFPAEEAEELVRHLNAVGRLTPSLILRAICVGDVGFFEAALAELANVAIHNARLLIHDAGHLGLKSLYERAGLPQSFYRAFRVALQVAHETAMDGMPYDRERYRRQVLERILTQFEDMETDDLDYLMIRLGDPNPALHRISQDRVEPDLV